MKFEKLRIVGFKTFVDPTEFMIEPGLTGVVGPNGCGKSNLVEAMRWVMGETSFKSMRASAMDDVIFNGSGGRPARNMAETNSRQRPFVGPQTADESTQSHPVRRALTLNPTSQRRQRQALWK